MSIQKIPLAVKRVGRTEVQTREGRFFSIGITPMHVRLDATKIAYISLEQNLLSRQVADVARELTLLPHLRYVSHIGDGSPLQGSVPSFFFEEIGALCFASKAGICPSQAIESLWRPGASPVIIECTIATQLVFYRAMMQCLGGKLFNRCFDNAPLILESSIGRSHPLFRYLKLINSEYRRILEDPDRYMAVLEPGDMVYISNISPYIARHPFGNSKGFNVIYTGHNTNGEAEFGGLFSRKRLHTYDEIVDTLVDDYNKTSYGQKEVKHKRG